MAELANININLDNLRNGDTANVTLSSSINLEQSSSVAVSNAASNLLQSDLNGGFDIGLSDELVPQTVKGKLSLKVTHAAEALRSLAGIEASLECALTPTNLEDLLLTFTREGKPLGRVSLKGPLDLNQREGRLNLEVSGTDRQALNLAGAAVGVDFGTTTISSTHEITLAQGGQLITAKGNLNLNQLNVSRTNVSSRPIDLQVDYETALNRAEHSAAVKSLKINAAQNSVPFIHGALASPMTLSFGGASSAVGDAAFSLTITNLNLADWRSLVGDYSGSLNLTLNLLCQRSGGALTLDLASQLADFSGKFGSNQIANADVTLSARAGLDDFARIQLHEYNLQLSRRKQMALSASGSGNYDLKSQEARARTEVELSLPKLLGIVAVPEAQISSGALKLNLQIAQRQNGADTTNAPVLDRTASGNVQLRDLSGHYAAFRFDNLETSFDWDAQLKDNHLAVRKLAGKLRQSGQAAGAFEATADFDLGSPLGQATVALTDVNQNALRTFFAPAPGDKTLESISITAGASARFAAKGEAGVRGNLQIANLVISDPKSQLPKTPLSADFTFDGLLRGDQAELKEFVGNLRLADQPGGGFNVSGKYDLKNQTSQVALKLIDLNQNALSPFVGRALGDKTLSSVSVYADTTAVYDANGESALKGAMVITNLLVIDSTGKLPRIPLWVGLQLDGAFGKKVLNLRQVQLNLSPTDRAKNEVLLSGRVDLNQSNVISGELQLGAEGIDLTPYYDLFAAAPSTNATTATENKSKPSFRSREAPANAAKEPAPVELPFHNFNFALNIGQLYLREITINNWLANVKLNGGKIDLKPFDLVLNGAPLKISANLNLGAPGYQYDLGLSAERIPLEPIVNTFQPEKRGQMKGDLIAQAQVKGAGVTGVNLRKNLSGQFDFNFANASLKIASPRARAFFAPIALLLDLPDLAGSPLNSIRAEGRMGNSKINLTHFNVTSDSFLADTAGEITIADELMNSPIEKSLIHLSVPRAAAERLHMVPKDAPSDSAFVKLPDFAKIAGTLGEPKAEIDKKSLSSAAARKL
ncbi:MAG: hypothetical protein DME22_24160, partial [Verrucomicrobia bacterium]